MNFNEAKTVLESVTRLVKASATIDLQEKIVNLREYILSLKDENISLKEENQNLKQEISLESDFELKNGMYWKEGDESPLCQKCMDGSKKTIHLQDWGNGFKKCYECNNTFGAKNSVRASVYRPNNDYI